MGRRTKETTSTSTSSNNSNGNFKKADAFAEIVILQEIVDENGEVVEVIEHRIPKDLPIYKSTRIGRSMIAKTEQDSEFRFKAMVKVKVVDTEPKEDIKF